MQAAALARLRGRWVAGVRLGCAARLDFADGINARFLWPVEEAGLPADCKPVEQAEMPTAGFDPQAGLFAPVFGLHRFALGPGLAENF